MRPPTLRRHSVRSTLATLDLDYTFLQAPVAVWAPVHHPPRLTRASFLLAAFDFPGFSVERCILHHHLLRLANKSVSTNLSGTILRSLPKMALRKLAFSGGTLWVYGLNRSNRTDSLILCPEENISVSH